MSKNFSDHDGFGADQNSGTAFDRFLRQQRRSGRRWASGGKFDPRQRENWDDFDYENDDFDEYSEYDEYDEDEFDSYSN